MSQTTMCNRRESISWESKMVHMIELDPSEIHSTNGTDCWCEPDVEEQPDGSLLVIHKDKTEHN